MRVHPSGEKSYYLRSRVGVGRTAKQRKVRIGSVDQIALADARSRAISLAGELRRGEDPVEKKRKSRTVAELVKRYEKSLQARAVVNRKAVVSSL